MSEFKKWKPWEGLDLLKSAYQQNKAQVKTDPRESPNPCSVQTQDGYLPEDKTPGVLWGYYIKQDD